jgi:hypothetical protein
MECPKCNGKATKYGFENGKQKYKCTQCSYAFTDNTAIKEAAAAPKVGMNLKEFTQKYDKEYILNTTLSKVMKSLKKDVVYERADIITMTGLGNGYAGMSNALEAYDLQYGKANSKVFFSHPDTIAFLKSKAKLT